MRLWRTTHDATALLVRPGRRSIPAGFFFFLGPWPIGAVNYPRLKSRASLARRDNDLKYCSPNAKAFLLPMPGAYLAGRSYPGSPPLDFQRRSAFSAVQAYRDLPPGSHGPPRYQKISRWLILLHKRWIGTNCRLVGTAYGRMVTPAVCKSLTPLAKILSLALTSRSW